MKIVEAQPPKSKAGQFRKIAKKLLENSNFAVVFDNSQDVHYFNKTLKEMGLKTTCKKQKDGRGWYVWVRK